MEKTRLNRRSWLVLACGLSTGCVSLRSPTWLTKSELTTDNPILVRAQSPKDCWEKTVDLIHDYFDIARENQLDGIIETRPKVGASMWEPWHHDSVGMRNRMESTFQSIRRRAFVNITPAEEGYLIGVEVFKESEDVKGRTDNSPGQATFQENRTLQRDLRLVVGQSSPDGWITLGRDSQLEQRMLRELQTQFSEPTK
ncbi:MAG: hypothetical protein U0903_06450 [Planctomycetales bacterium]